MATAARFHLYVKAGKDGKCLGDCPFSQRANMFARMNLDQSELHIVYVDTGNKPPSFLKLNPEGKVPVMFDTKENKIITDSAEITKYIGKLSDIPNVQNEELLARAVDAFSGVFPKFASMMKNKDESKDEELKAALTAELGKLNSFLVKNRDCGRFLTDDTLREEDCRLLPVLKHVQVAGKEYKAYNIPGEFSTLLEYIKNGEEMEVFKLTCPTDEQFIWGWSKFF